MTSSILDPHQGFFILLLEAGFIAVNQADEDAAKKLFDAAHMLEPKNSLPQIGFGYLHLHKLELTQACKIFEGILKKDPEDANKDMCKAFLGICTAMQPNLVDKGEKMLDDTLKTKDPLVKQLAYTAIDFVERFVKKAPGPASVQAKK
jgi:predicted TPR repeat methyltransferase